MFIICGIIVFLYFENNMFFYGLLLDYMDGYFLYFVVYKVVFSIVEVN